MHLLIIHFLVFASATTVAIAGIDISIPQVFFSRYIAFSSPINKQRASQPGSSPLVFLLFFNSDSIFPPPTVLLSTKQKLSAEWLLKSFSRHFHPSVSYITSTEEYIVETESAVFSSYLPYSVQGILFQVHSLFFSNNFSLSYFL